ncbi:hypothetical protein JY651_28355 [Pyxidicoccus parkwayensis]|uniref:Uncharacterized protein n=1 Tax=Pyxidicoccus parkwayensis TaxID=2813578 RepID=A0ABX7NP77_9BACT|nr:hypothetical protein [Pyxidicoccus parkwaysis]QSQ19249.1 hypothetical protein JY651_28355 [Pyxidicoccus parkwaysis]
MGADFFRQDQSDEITPPNLGMEATYAEHIVHARGKRTQYTSLSTDPSCIKDFGPQLWRFHEAPAAADGHRVLGHQDLVATLREELTSSRDRKARELAARALPRAIQRKEALVLWAFDISRISRKELSEWARPHVRRYFTRA